MLSQFVPVRFTLRIHQLLVANQVVGVQVKIDNQHAELMHLAVEAAPNGMVMVAPDGTIVLVNAKTGAMFGYERDELVGQPIEMLVPNRYRDAHPERREQYFREPQTRPMGKGRDLYGVRKDGEEFPVEIGLNPIDTDVGRFVLAAIVDITERKTAQEDLRRAHDELELRVQERTEELLRSNKELDDFAYVASHDLRSPLETIRTLAGWINKDAAAVLPAKSQRHLQQLQQRILRMERLLEDLLQYSRAGRIHHELVEVDTDRLVREVADLLNRPDTFTVSVADNMPVIVTEKVPLAEVIRNLIHNAIKHRSRDDGRVSVSCDDADEFIEFSVADDGPGIEPAFHEQIFGMFETLRPRDHVEASGMGLALVKKTVEKYGGTIHLESTPGHGAMFRFTWPKNIK